MSALVAEGYEFGLEQAPDLRLVHSANAIAIPELEEDETLRQETERKIRAIGFTAISTEFEHSPQSNDSLLSAIKRAEKGNMEARSMVATNVGSDFSERVLKAGEVTKYYLKKNDDGELIQHGQLYSDIYSNTLRLTPKNSKMRPRTEAEARNADRAKLLESQGKLEDNCMVAFSLVPDNMTDIELKKAGFFVETKTMAIQVTAAEGDVVSIESAFVAGTPEPGSDRHDLQAIVKLAAILGVDYRNMTTTEILDTPLLIPKSFMPNGVIDLVKLFDDCASGTFFGEPKMRQDYLAFRRFCDERRRSFSVDVNVVTEKLIQEASVIKTQLQAIERLAELSEEQMVKRAIKDKTIDERVFGGVSASYIQQARMYREQGNAELARRAENNAIKTADSDSCPSGMSRQSEIDSEASTSENNKSEVPEDCDFVSKQCPVCGEKNAKTRVKKGKYYHVGKSCKA